MADGNYKEILDYALEQIHKKYKSQNLESDFNLWFNLEYISDSENTISVAVPSEFLISQIKSRGYATEIIEKIKEISGQQIELNYVVKETEKSKKIENELNEKNNSQNSKNTKNSKKESEKQNIKKHPQLREDFTFDTFVPGENNNLAYNVAISVAKELGKQQRYNPLLFYGGSGLGKTHLMQSIGNYVNENSEKPLKICYISAESFTNEFTSSISEKTTEKFKSKYRNLDLLLIDDIHFLQGKNATQEELFYTFEALVNKNAQMVFTCDRPISDLKDFNKRMTTRLSSGGYLDMNPPNYETRRAILQKKLEIQNIKIPDDVIDYIAKNVETNVRDLESALNKMIGYAEIIQKPLTVEIAQEQLRDIFNTANDSSISIETIQKVVENFFNISDIKAKKKDKKTVIPRQIAIYLCRELTEYSFMEIAREFGGKDHSTIMHANSKISEQIKTDSALAAKIQLLKDEIKNYKK